MVVYGLVAWSFLVELIGGVINANHWLLDTSVFHQLAGAPAVAPDWTSAGALVGLGLVSGALGVVAFQRRDLASA
jgi:ABC-2 type transport system permease protein